MVDCGFRNFFCMEVTIKKIMKGLDWSEINIELLVFTERFTVHFFTENKYIE